jgi:hypothetical protein
MVGLATLVGLLAPAAAVFAEDPELTVERAAREYRIRIYERYRLRRDQYDLHREAGEALMRAWIAAGQPAKSRQAVVGWYQRAADLAAPNQLPPLPLMPSLATNRGAPASSAPKQAAGPPAAPSPDRATSRASEAAASPPAPGTASNPSDQPPSPQVAKPTTQKGSFRFFSGIGKAVLRAAKFSQSP